MNDLPITPGPEGAWERTQREFACAHESKRLAVKIGKRGSRHYRIQCELCWQVVRRLTKAELSPQQRDAAVELDEASELEFIHRRSARHAELQREDRDKKNLEWWARYEAYLDSPEWRAIRAKVLLRARDRCEACGIRRATAAHHLTYKRLGHEELSDLVAVCDQCHAQIHPNRAPAGETR